MALPLANTIANQDSAKKILAGGYQNIRIHQMSSNMNGNLPWSTLFDAVNGTTHSKPSFLGFSATCYYFGEGLTDELGHAAPPIGLIHTAVGGSYVSQWSNNATILACGDNITLKASDGGLWAERVVPYLAMSIRGWVW